MAFKVIEFQQLSFYRLDKALIVSQLKELSADFFEFKITYSLKNLKYSFSRIYTGDFFATRFEDFFMWGNLSRRVVTHTRQDSLAAIAFGKNRRRVSNTCDLRCRLYFHYRFPRHESPRAKSRSCKQQIVSNLRVATA